MATAGVGVGSLFRDTVTLAGVALAVAVAGGAGWALFGSKSDDGPRAKDVRPTHLHCPACEDEIAFVAALDGQTCEKCGGDAYVATVGSFREGEDGTPWGRVVLFLLITLLAAQGVVFLGAHRLKAVRAASERERNRLYVCACPYCARKVKYPAAKAGTGFMCVKCKTAFTLAPVDEAEVDADG